MSDNFDFRGFVMALNAGECGAYRFAVRAKETSLDLARDKSLTFSDFDFDVSVSRYISIITKCT